MMHKHWGLFLIKNNLRLFPSNLQNLTPYRLINDLFNKFDITITQISDRIINIDTHN